MKPKLQITSLVMLLVILAGLIFGITHLQALDDWWKLRGYTPPAAIVSLADQDTMNSYTRHAFYVNHPQLLSTVSAFRQACPDSEQTIVLGCYHPGQNGIYIYNVQDPALHGVQQVTAAHEVLHSVYARLSSSDRQQLDNELESYYKNDLHDSRVLAEVKLYQQTEPNDVYDEMSCTFGTEIANLPPALEAYYAKYFTNRQAVVAFEQSYEGEFTKRENIINADDAQLAAMKQQIDSEESSLTNQLNQIEADRARLDQLSSSNQINAYNAGVDSFNAEVDAYNSGVQKLRSDIAAYNQLVQDRNSVAAELRGLQSAIDTRLTTQATQ